MQKIEPMPISAQISDEITATLTERIAEVTRLHKLTFEAALQVGLHLLDIKKIFEQQYPPSEPSAKISRESGAKYQEYLATHTTLKKTVAHGYVQLARYYLATGQFPLKSSLTVAIESLALCDEMQRELSVKEANGEKITMVDVRARRSRRNTYHTTVSNLNKKLLLVSTGKVPMQDTTKEQWLSLRDELDEASDTVSEIIKKWQ